ncbi:hypothetical protein K469DRAFT_745046 [Zopfia rhizophila CBS 207.26]|uniref:Zn(2)-C6 fungal-type domain-containing protein n=1 Tax=Zopfia rhizophila CBS 207.26 TaxID=1314779 RepID=A0A6A6ETL2_9PEZI|nr:hypothetical protein K469DRAFT_745046 [Zopfia rhizophila CBS 207.26]
MASLKRSSDGCWTCRLRRKRCDEGQPKCGGCNALEITCHYSIHKPEKKDGGTKQRKVAKRIKTQVKQSADYRRERHAAAATGGAGDHNFVITLERDSACAPAKLKQSQLHEMSEDIASGSSNTEEALEEDIYQPSKDVFAIDSLMLEVSSNLPLLSHDAIRSSPVHKLKPTASPLSFIGDPQEGSGYPPYFSGHLDYEADFLIKYLDYVFPFLFPFYRPVKQADKSFEMIQQEIQELNLRGTQVGLLEKARVMQSIIQLLIFEVTVGRSVNWNVHLSPALALFEDIFHNHGLESSDSKLLCVLDRMAQRALYKIDYNHYVWTTDQAGFCFFTAVLVFIDIIASTSLEPPPRLLKYHLQLLADLDNHSPDNGAAHLQLSSVIGCQNWALVAVGKIADLDAWKKDRKRASTLSMVELVERASHIAQDLSQGIARMDSGISDSRTDKSFGPQSFFHSSLPTCLTTPTTPTRIWANSAKIYLAIVVSGWQVSNTEVRSGVAQTLELLQTVTAPAHLRMLAWPFCVAGCLAEAGKQEQEFRDLLAGMSALEVIGPLGEARCIMEKVWQNREAMDRETWDLAACFCILGAPALLV